MNQPISSNQARDLPFAGVSAAATVPQETPRLHTISVYLKDKPGVLGKLSLVFSRRGFNIESLIVSPAGNSGYSRMTVTCTGDHATLEQIINQLGKLVDVLHVTDSTDRATVQTELALIKVRANLDTRTQLLQVADHFEAKVVDFASESVIIRICGSTARLDALLGLLEPYGVIEFVRTGKVVMSRGSELT